MSSSVLPSRASQRHKIEVHGQASNGETINNMTVDVGSASIAGAGTSDHIVNLITLNGVLVVGATLVVQSSDEGVATVAVGGVTDASGNATVTITGVAAGTARISVQDADGGILIIPVTVT